MASGLQVKNINQVISGGYNGEWHDIDGPGYRDWTDVELDGFVSCSYYYRDSNTSNNYQSTQVNVGIMDSWSATVDPNTNVITVRTTSYLTNVSRNDLRGDPRYPYYGVQRNIYIRQYRDGPVLQSWISDDIGSNHLIFSGSLLLGSREFQLYPRGGASERGSIYYRNNTTGHDGDTPPNEYIDEFWMGAQFRNVLPQILPAPTLTQLKQTEDICEYKVTTDWWFHQEGAGNIGTRQYYLDIATKPDFSDAYRYYASSSSDTYGFANIVVKPTQHYYWRSQMVGDTQYISGVVSGDFTAIAVIPPQEVVPEFDETDCERLTTNKTVGVWPTWEGVDE